MKTSIASSFSLLASLSLLLSGAPVGAAALLSSTFTSVGLTNTQDIDLTGPDVVDWGYYTVRNSFFSTPALDNSKAASGIGAVTIVPGAVSDGTFNWSPSLPKFTMTFDDGDSPATGTEGMGAGLGAWGATEDNAATFTFNDLGVGTHTVRVFVGHSSNDRIFDMDYSVIASDGNLSGNTVSNSIASGDLHSTYEIVFSTADPSTDLTLQFNSTSGGTGSGWIGGYVVETVAPASSIVLEITSNGDFPRAYDFEWNSKAGKLYDLVSATDLVSAVTTWPVWQGQADLVATPPLNTLTNIPGEGPRRFFAVIEKDAPPLLDAKFEANDGGFTIAKTAGTDWANGTPNSTGFGGTVDAGNGAASGEGRCWGTNIGNPGFYADPTTDSSLSSTVIDLIAKAGAELSFAQALDFPAEDSAVVRIINADTGIEIVGGAFPLTVTDADISSASWQSSGPHALPVGARIRIEWCLSGTAGDTNDFMGWYVDDVLVLETFP